jgi:hypothetical protein
MASGGALPPIVAVSAGAVTTVAVPPTPSLISRPALDLHRRLGQQAQRHLAVLVDHVRYPAVAGFQSADADKDADLVAFMEHGRLNPAAAAHLSAEEHVARGDQHHQHAKAAFEGKRYLPAAEHFAFAAAHALMAGVPSVAIQRLCNCATSLLHQVGKEAASAPASSTSALAEDAGDGGGKFADMLQMSNVLLTGARNLTYAMRTDDPVRPQWISTVFNVTYLARETELASLKSSAALLTGDAGGGGVSGGTSGAAVASTTATLLANRLIAVVNDMHEIAHAHLDALKAAAAGGSGAGAGGTATASTMVLRSHRQVEDRLARTGEAGSVRVEVAALAEKLTVAAS